MPYTVHQHLEYSFWATTRMTDTLSQLDEEILNREIKSSFTSIAKTLLHIWDAEVIWLNRMKGMSLLDWPSKNFHGDCKMILEGVVESSKDLQSFINMKGCDFLTEKISYKNLKGDSFEDVVEDLIYHIVNHGAYHRGQITTLLHQLGTSKIQSTDIIVYLRSLKK